MYFIAHVTSIQLKCGRAGLAAKVNLGALVQHEINGASAQTAFAANIYSYTIL